MVKVIFLSHILTPKTPGYGGVPGFKMERVKSISRGNSSNNSQWTLSNHIGTHVDAPFHFSNQGENIERFTPEFWIFEAPFLVDRSAKPGELIDSGAWSDSIPDTADLVLLRTGSEAVRGQRAYWERGPGLAPGVGEWLRAHRPRVRALGVDFISVTSWQERATGCKAHAALLDPSLAGRPVVVIEDMALAGLTRSPGRAVIAPIRVAGGDASPVTVFAEVEGD
jgi:arylformamidase